MKKILSIFIILLLTLFTIRIDISAKPAYLEGYEEVGETQEENLTGNVNIYKKYVKTIHNGVGTTYNNHTVNYAISNANNGVRTVVYTSDYAHNWVALTTKQAMQEWEEAHPGWICLAGVNGDGFDIRGTKQPYHYHMEDGNFYRPQGYGVIFGFKDNNEFVDGNPVLTSNMFIRKYDESHENIVSENEIKVINRTPDETGINLYTKDNQYPVDLTGYFVYDCLYDLTRCGFSNVYSFVRGTATSIIPGTTEMTPNIGHFYLASKNDDLKNALKIGDYFKCEYKLTGTYQDVTQMVGCPNQLVEGDILYHKGSTVPFECTTHPRTCVGVRENGDVIILTVDGRGPSDKYLVGASLYECEQIMKKLGCIKAFNMDGGGSTTLVARMNDGKFKVLNTPSDGRERRCGNHVLFVMKDPGFKIDIKDLSYSEGLINLNVKDENTFKNVSNIKVNVNNFDYDYNSNGIKITGLKENTTYTVCVSYDLFDEKLDKISRYSFKQTFTTKPIPYPENVIKVDDIDGTSFVVYNNNKDFVKDLNVTVNNHTYNLDGLDKIKISSLLVGHEYEIKYSYTFNDNNGVIRKYEGTPFNVSTNIFDKPTGLILTEFSKASKILQLQIKFSDPDGIIDNAIILENGIKIKDIAHRKGSNSEIVTLKDIDFTKDQTFQVVLSYKTKENEEINIESNILEYRALKEDMNKDTKKCGKKCGSLVVKFISLLMLIILIFKKYN